MKKRHISLGVILCIILLWLGSILTASILTVCFAYEFTDFEAIGAPWLDDYGYYNNTKIRVLSYSGHRAKVYFYSNKGGECILFIKCEGQWKYEKTLANWSGAGGSADDYFIWPYYKHYVP